VVAQGVAWTVPVVAIGRAAPALAASGNEPTGDVGAGCKLAGSSCAGAFVKGYVFEVTLTNTTGQTIFLYNQSGFPITITENNPDIDLFFQNAVDATTGQIIRFPFEMPNGTMLTVLLNAAENGTSANQPIAGSIFFPWGHTPIPPDPHNHPDLELPFSYSTTPPINNPACSLAEPPACGTF
jgi:hypothetical protein